jgi:hypothetical protein
MSGGTFLLKTDDITWTATNEGTVVVLDLRSSEYLSVNASAAPLWQLLADGQPVESLVQRLQNDFNLDRAAAETDVKNFLDELMKRGLLDEKS